MTRFICIFFSLIAYRERESVISRDAVQQSKCSGTSQECKPACRRSSRANKFAGSLNQAVNVTWQNHDDMMKTESLSKIRPDEADRTIKSINKPPRDSVKSKYTFAYYHDRDRRKCKWQDSLWSRKCLVSDCQLMTTLNFGWCPAHLHELMKITTGTSPLGGLGQFATALHGHGSVVFRKGDRILQLNALCQLISEKCRIKRYGKDNTPTYAAIYAARAADGSGFRFDKRWKQPKEVQRFHRMYCDGALTLTDINSRSDVSDVMIGDAVSRLNELLFSTYSNRFLNK